MEQDIKDTITDEERLILKNALKQLSELSEQRKKLNKERDKLLKNNSPKSALGDILFNNGKERALFEKTEVSIEPQHQRRNITLETVYQAVENILGKEKAMQVKEHINTKRKERRNQLEFEDIKFIKIGLSRKKRSDAGKIRKEDDVKLPKKKLKTQKA